MASTFDEHELLDRVDKDLGFLAETVEMLESDAPPAMQQIRDALAAGDAPSLGRAAHALKGIVSNFCAPQAQAGALAVEQMGKAGDLSRAPEAVRVLGERLEALLAELATFVKEENVMRILVAEDDRITRASLIRQLTAWNHQVTEAPDGEAAWTLFQAAQYDLVITDWEMPRVSGVELIQRIRQANCAEYVYVIMLTSRSDKSDVVKGIEGGADDFVCKPFDREELRVRLLAGERIIHLEHALNQQNAQLREARDRIRRDLDAAARVQRAMLPRQNIVTAHARAAWAYEPTDELAGDAIGLHLIDDRYLAAYVVDVSGHGVPAALLSVTAMHYLEPEPESASLLRDRSRSAGLGSVQRPSVVATELNRRFSADNSDSRFLTMVLCVLDTFEGRLVVASAGHPPPLILRNGSVVPVPDAGGLPVAMFEDAKYEDVTIQLEPGDRVYLFSDGIVEQPRPDGQEGFGEVRLADMLLADCDKNLTQVVAHGVDALADWAGGRRFTDDVSLVAVEWIK